MGDDSKNGCVAVYRYLGSSQQGMEKALDRLMLDERVSKVITVSLKTTKISVVTRRK